MPELRRFGRFEILKRIAAGGMAEIYLASQTGQQGFRKTVVLKRILPEFADDPRFVEMFVEEAKIAAALDHDSIVKVYDFGSVEGNYFLAMEYVDGRDLAFILDDLAPRSELLPLEAALHVSRRVASALHYAHTKSDEQGRPMGIVHRDISPQNILISKAGAVKILDFGIARAKVRTRAATMHEIKGKAAYMSPEQARGESPGAASDIYSLGLVLYEMATGRQGLSGESDMAALEAARNPNPLPPSVANNRVDKDLEEIILKALAPNPLDRYSSALAMEEALDDYCRKLPSFIDKDLSRWMSERFKPIAPEGRVTEIMEVPAAEPARPFQSAKHVPPSAPPANAEKSVMGRYIVAAILLITVAAAITVYFKNRPSSQSSGVGQVVAERTVGIAPPETATTRPLAEADQPEAQPSGTKGKLVIETRPNGALVTANGEYRGQSPVTLAQPTVKDHADVETSLPGFQANSSGHQLPKEGSTRSVRSFLEKAYGNLDLRGCAGCRVFADGRPVDQEDGLVQLAAGVHEIRVEKAGRSRALLITIAPGTTVPLPIQNDSQ